MLKKTWKGHAAAALSIVVLISSGCGGDRKSRESDQTLPAIVTEENLIVNPGLEEWQGKTPFGWRTVVFSGEGTNEPYYGKSEKASSGRYSFFIRGEYKTDRWIALTQRLPVRPGHMVVFSADIMTERIERDRGQEDNLCIYARFYDAEGNRINDRYFADAFTSKRTGSNDWLKKQKKTEVPDKAVLVEVGLLNQMTGYAYFDNVSFVIKEKLDWESKNSKFITYNWSEGREFPADDMKRVSSLVENVAKEMGIKKLDKKINYYLYPDEATFKKVLSRNRYRTLARWDRKELHDIKSFNDHEIIHLLLYDLGFPPVGISKGLVWYFRAKYNDWDLSIRSKRFLTEQQIPALHKTIDPKTWQSINHAVIVPAWASFAEYLIDRYGMETYKDLYIATDKVIEDKVFSEIFKEIYGLDFLETDRAWRLHTLRYEGDAAADTLPDVEKAR
jgi:hypothetical protein